jgi:AcrR family transcriptional regulator
MYPNTLVSQRFPDKGENALVVHEVGSEGEPRRLTRQQSRARTRALLVEAAGRVFAERGYHGASVEEITERAGFSRGAFYSNFDSKEDLFLAVVDAHMDFEIRSASEALQEGSSPEAFQQFLRSRAVRRSKEGRQWTLLWSEFWLHVVRHPELAPKLATRQRAARAATARVIEIQCGQLGIELSVPSEELASVLLAVDDGLVLQEYLDPGAVPEDLRAKAAIFLVRGMALTSGDAGSPEP